jgi:hypothetical protein
MRIAFAVVSLLALCECTPTGGVQCVAASDCGPGGVCLPIGSCAVGCSATSSSCIAGEKCSKAGGCVPASGCGSDLDCGSGNLCQLGTCGPSCTATSCGAGGLCQADGHCMLLPPGGAGGGGGTATCGGEVFQSTHVQANFLIVLDHSGSMMSTVSGVSKWKLASDAVKAVTAQYQAQIRFGLSMFSTPVKCDPGRNYVPVGDLTAMAIAGSLPTTADGNGTPIGAALKVASMHPGLMDPGRANFVMVVTDGKENCNGNPVNEVKALSAANVKTFVVGFGAEVDATMLSNMAVNGGTARNTTPRYYQADDQQGLNAAFNSIAAGAVGCDFKLSKTPPNPNDISVYVNGQLIPRDPQRKVGWEYTGGSDRVTLYGTVCDAVASDPSAKVQIIYGCPGGLIEGGDGGSKPIDLDAGWIN